MLQWWSAWVVAYGAVVSTSAKLPTLSSSLTSVHGTDNSSISEFLTSLLQNPWTWWLFSILSPLFTMHILLNVPGTGIAHAEGKNLKRYYESESGDAYKIYRYGNLGDDECLFVRWSVFFFRNLIESCLFCLSPSYQQRINKPFDPYGRIQVSSDVVQTNVSFRMDKVWIPSQEVRLIDMSSECTSERVNRRRANK